MGGTVDGGVTGERRMRRVAIHFFVCSTKHGPLGLNLNGLKRAKYRYRTPIGEIGDGFSVKKRTQKRRDVIRDISREFEIFDSKR